MPPSTNSADNRTRFNTGKQSGDHVEEDNTSSSAQAQMLFTALRNVVIPLIQTALPTQKDLCSVPLGPEAEDLLVALQNFIASIIRDQSDNEAGDDVTALVKRSHKAVASAENSSSRKEGSTAVVRSIANQGAPNNLKQTEMLWKALSALRQHVFDTMPIRLLRFGSYESKFEITLVEREQIYTELSERLKAEVNEKAELGDINKMVSNIAQYSILSHTWLRDGAREVTYDDWLKRDFDTEQPGYQKLYNFCIAAAEYGFTYGWMDTVCINKASSAELDESIRSMYKWYGQANICITYLAATSDISAMEADPWFTRGWTLQELIAPDYIKFYNMNWNKLVNDWRNDKINTIILDKIESASTITRKDMADLASVMISRKMQWAARREVTRGEDAAYSLIGIFNVNISIAYGEGPEQAFLRLLKEILNTTKIGILDIFNWAGKYETKHLPLLPSSPKAYLQSYSTQRLLRNAPIEPLTITHLGLRIPVLLLLGMATTTPKLSYRPIGIFHATVKIETSMPEISQYYNLLARNMRQAILPTKYYQRIAFAVLDFHIYDTTISIPHRCLAVAATVTWVSSQVNAADFEKKIPTKKPIIFDLLNTNTQFGGEGHYYRMEKKDLEKHGMQQINMFL